MSSRFRVTTLICVHRVAGPWLFPLPPWPSPVSELTFEASPVDRHPGAPAAVQALPLSLQVRSLRDLHSHQRLSTVAGPSPVLLSCSSPCVPLRQRSRVRPLPVDVAVFLWSNSANCPIVFRPRGLSPPRRVAPLMGLRACCIPKPAVGSAAFPAPATRPPSSHPTPRCPLR